MPRSYLEIMGVIGRIRIAKPPMYNVTAESQGLSWELKVAAQERQKLFLQELEGRLIAPPHLR